MESNGEEEQGLDQDDEEDILAHLERICNQSSKVYDSYPKSGKGFFDMAFYQLDTKRVPANILAFGGLPLILEPREQDCCHCKNVFSGPCEITS